MLAASVPSNAGIVWGDKTGGLATHDTACQAEVTTYCGAGPDLTSLLQDLWRVTVQRFGTILAD